MSFPSDATVIKQGTFLYDDLVECDIRIVHSSIFYGNGEEDDLECDTYYIQYGSTTQRGYFNAISGGFFSLNEAIIHAESATGIGKSIRWTT